MLGILFMFTITAGLFFMGFCLIRDVGTDQGSAAVALIPGFISMIFTIIVISVIYFDKNYSISPKEPITECSSTENLDLEMKKLEIEKERLAIKIKNLEFEKEFKKQQ